MNTAVTLESYFAQPTVVDAKIQICPEHGAYTPLIQAHPICPICAAATFEAQRQNLITDEIKKLEDARKAACGIPERYSDCGFKNYEEREQKTTYAKNICKSFALAICDSPKNKIPSRSLIITGPTGTGKTHLACAIIRNVMFKKLLQVPKFGRYVTSAEAVDEVLGAYKNIGDSESAAIYRFTDPDLLVIDEVGLDDGRDTQKSALNKIINARYNVRKPTVVVSNLNKLSLKEFIGDRSWSRLCENSKLIEMNINDQRVGL